MELFVVLFLCVVAALVIYWVVSPSVQSQRPRQGARSSIDIPQASHVKQQAEMKQQRRPNDGFRPADSEQLQHFHQVKEEHRPREKMVVSPAE
jgi:hypothetical protein